MRKTLNEMAAILNGKVVGDGLVVVERIQGIDEAGEGDLTFIANPQYRKKLETTNASAILVSPGTESTGKNLLVVSDPYVALGQALALFYPEEPEPVRDSKDAFIEGEAVVSKEAQIYPGVYIGRGARIERGVVLYPNVFVGRDAVIGEDSILYPNVTVYRRCIIGKRVILHAGVVVGSDGFGFARPGQENLKIPQVGIVQIDDDVEVGANTTIDRGTLSKTWIQRGVKIDNLVQIGHNVIIGENSVIVAQVAIAGSARLGKSCIIGGQAGIAGHISIGDHVTVVGQSGVIEDLPPDQIVSGTPQMPHRRWLRVQACIPQLPEMRKTITSLVHRIKKLEEVIKNNK